MCNIIMRGPGTRGPLNPHELLPSFGAGLTAGSRVANLIGKSTISIYIYIYIYIYVYTHITYIYIYTHIYIYIYIYIYPFRANTRSHLHTWLAGERTPSRRRAILFVIVISSIIIIISSSSSRSSRVKQTYFRAPLWPETCFKT